jgi:hypothetical protein
MSLAIKSGGHNVSEAFLRNGGILLDLGELQGIEIDAENQTAWVQPALWSHGLLRMLAPHGLAFPVAHCATVPMGGYLLGGGLGYNHDNWGILACHSVLAAEVVLANGEGVVLGAAWRRNGFFRCGHPIQAATLYRTTVSLRERIHIPLLPLTTGHITPAGLGAIPPRRYRAYDVARPQPDGTARRFVR